MDCRDSDEELKEHILNRTLLKNTFRLGNREKKMRMKEFGRIRFSRSTERTVFFVLTMAMLAMGILVKMGIL